MFWTAVYNILRSLFFSIDKIIYDLIGNVYGLLLQICRTSVFDTDAIHSFSSRIYVFIGLFMLFKLTISLITYILNPDDFSKGEKSFGTIVKKAIFALVMVVLCPYIFTELFEVQSIILEENTIMNIAFGTPNDSSASLDRISNSTYADSAGEKIKFTLAFTFAQPNYEEFAHDGIADLIDCKYTYEKDSNGNFKFRKRAKFNSTEVKDSNYIYSLDPSCWGIYDPDADEYIDDGVNGQLLKAFDATEVPNSYQDYAQGVAQQNYSLFFKKEAIVQARTSNGKYVINYKFVVSTAVGVITLYLLLMYCIDLAVRSIKLGFLQMIAPIPILSYVDPKSGKDGMFNKWFKSCKNTYLDLFIRLFALYFGIYIITLVGKFRDVVTGEIVDNWIVRIFMIIGVLIFIKKLPEFLKETLGFEGAGTFKGYMNPIKKLEDDALFGKKITSLTSGAASAGLAGAAAFGTNLIAKKGNPFSAIAGGLSATGRGLVGAVKGEKFGKNFSKSYSGAMNARTNRDDRRELGVNGLDIAGENIRKALHIPNAADKYKVSLEHLKDYTSAGEAVKSRAEAEVDKKANSININGENLGAMKNYVDVLKNQDTSGMTQAQQQAHAKAISDAEAKYFKNRKVAVNAYVSNANSLNQTTITMGTDVVTGFNNAYTGAAAQDTVVTSNIGKMKQLNRDFNMHQEVEISDIGSSIQSAQNETARIEGSREFRQAQLIAQQAQKEKK